MAINILISIGTNLLLDKAGYAGELAKAIVVLENYDESVYNSPEALFCNRGVASKVRDFVYGENETNKRDILKFYRKRTSCKCLKAMHLEARKTLPKVGICYHCEERKERAYCC